MTHLRSLPLLLVAVASFGCVDDEFSDAPLDPESAELDADAIAPTVDDFELDRAPSEHVPLCGFECPWGTVPIFFGCKPDCGFGCPNAVLCEPPTPWNLADISADPSTVTVPPGGLGTTRICWDTDDLPYPVWIRVRVDGGPGQLFTRESDDGGNCADAPWIGANQSYVFTIHDENNDASPSFASVTVVGVPGSGGPGGPGDPVCNDATCQAGRDCHCGDICRPIGSICP